MDQLSSPSSPSDRDDLIDTGPDFSNPLTHPFSNTLYPFQSQSPFSHDNNIGGISNGNGHHHAGTGWQGNLGGKMGESSGSGFMGAGIDLTSGTTTGEILQPYAQMFTHNPHQHPQSSQPSHLNSSANNIRHSHTHHAQPHHPHLPSNYTHNQTHTHQSHTHTPNNVDLDDDDILATSIGSGQGVDDDLEAILPPAAMARFRTSFDSGSGTGTVNTAELTGRGTPGMYGSMTGFSNQQDQQMNPNISQQHPHASHPNYAQQQQNQQQQQQPPSVPATQPSSALSEEKARALESLLVKFWTRQMDLAERGTTSSSIPGNGAPSAVKDQEFKNFALPLARIKKVMKSDPDVKMISAEVPVLLGKCCEIFIAELTSRAWLVAQSNKRRTLQRTDVAAAIGYSDMFDFLIDIVPREEKGTDGPAAKKKATTGRKDSEVSFTGIPADELGKKRKREDEGGEENEEE